MKRKTPIYGIYPNLNQAKIIDSVEYDNLLKVSEDYKSIKA